MQKSKDTNIWRSKLAQKAVDIVDIDLSKRIVKGQMAAYGNIDHDEDRLFMGCMKKSFNDRGPQSNANAKIQHLYMHDMARIVGKPLELYEENVGAFYVSKIIGTQDATDRLIEMQEGVLNNNSVGFRYVGDKMRWNEDEKCWDIYEINLFEFSSVPFGANEKTPIISITKGLSKEDALAKLNEQFYANLRVSKSKASDEACKAAEYRLKLIHKEIIDLLTTPNPKAVKDTLKDEEPVTERKAGFFAHLIEQETRKNNFFNHLTSIKDEQTNFRGLPPEKGD